MHVRSFARSVGRVRKVKKAQFYLGRISMVNGKRILNYITRVLEYLHVCKFVFATTFVYSSPPFIAEPEAVCVGCSTGGTVTGHCRRGKVSIIPRMIINLATHLPYLVPFNTVSQSASQSTLS